ncbi:MAG: glycosyltransferase family 4 protein, partial [Anaerolineae bacterium]
GGRLLYSKHQAEYEEADAVVVPSQIVARSLIDTGVDASKIHYVHLGFSPERFQPDPSAKQDSTFRVIYAGAINLRKGVPYLLEAFRLLDLPDAELVLVGSAFPESRAFLPHYEGIYRHVPFVPQEELVALYNQASVFVLPSLEDGFGMVVYEAAACGLPVIVTENVGAPIRDGVDGFIVPIRDAEALAQKLLAFYQNPALRQQMGRAAHDYVQQFTWEAYQSQVLANYRQILQST